MMNFRAVYSFIVVLALPISASAANFVAKRGGRFTLTPFLL